MRFGLLLFFVNGAAMAWQDYSQVEITTLKLTDNLHMLTGAGGNIGVISGEDGVFLVDDQFAPLTDKIRAAVAAISKESVRFVFNTHWHYDHVGGNENFGKAGSVIVAHENVRKRMSTEQFMADFDRKMAPSPKDALPVVTFTRDMSFYLNGEEIKVVHVPHAHTDGDAVVFFTKANAVHMGDCYFEGFYPYIDVGSGGSIKGVIAAADLVLARTDAKSQIIPGHGPLSDKARLQTYREMLQGISLAVEKLIAAGKTREEVIAAKPTAPWDEKAGGGFIKPDTFAGIVFNSLSK